MLPRAPVCGQITPRQHCARSCLQAVKEQRSSIFDLVGFGDKWYPSSDSQSYIKSE